MALLFNTLWFQQQHCQVYQVTRILSIYIRFFIDVQLKTNYF